MAKFINKFQKIKKDTLNIIQLAEKGNKWLEINSIKGARHAKMQKINEHKRTLNRVVNASEKRPSIAIFGQSQVGKSFLVRSLAKSPITSKLEILNNKDTNNRIDFIQKINPPGGRESTGIITRFTTNNIQFENNDFPYQVELLSQLDVAAIIINGYLEDVKDYINDFDESKVVEVLLNIKKDLNNNHSSDINEDNVSDFVDFLVSNYKDDYRIKTCKKIGFFKDIIEILPKMNSSERWRILQYLWGENKFLTDLFNKLSNTVKDLNYSKKVYVNDESIINDSALGTKEFSFTTNILDVQRVKEIYKEKQLPELTVLNKDANKVKVSRSLFSALIKELRFQIPNDFETSSYKYFLNDTDILDFPGSKSREKVPENVFISNSKKEKLSLFVRGKVSFLFYLYNRDIGISTLLYCMDNEPPLVAESPSLLSKWINNYIGENPKERKQQQQDVFNLLKSENVEFNVNNISPLLVAMTKFNIELRGKGDAEIEGDLVAHNAKWDARFQENFSNYMSKPVQDKWTENWLDDNDSFKFIFPNRDPNFSDAIFESNENGELGIRPEKENKIKDLKKSFLSSDIVEKFIFDKNELWDEVISPNKTGIEYLCKYLAPSSHPAILIEQLNKISKKATNSILDILSKEYLTGDLDEDLKIAKRKAAKAHMALIALSNKNELDVFLDLMKVSELEIWRLLYDFKFNYKEQNQVEETNTKDVSALLDYIEESGINIETPLNIENIENELLEMHGVDKNELKEILDDSFGVNLEDLMTCNSSDNTPGNIFTNIVINFWIDKLNNLSIENEAIKKHKEVLESIYVELLNSKNLKSVKNDIINIVSEEMKNGVSKSQFDLIASCLSSLLNRFSYSAGWVYAEESTKPKLKSTEIRIFTENSILNDRSVINNKILNDVKRNFLSEFSIGVKELFVENVKEMHGVNNEFDTAANSEIGVIIGDLKKC